MEGREGAEAYKNDCWEERGAWIAVCFPSCNLHPILNPSVTVSMFDAVLLGFMVSAVPSRICLWCC